MYFRNTFYFSQLNFKLCLSISKLAGAILRWLVMSLTGSIIGWLKCVESTHYESVDFSAYTFQSLYTGFEWLLFRIDALYFRDISPVLDTSSRGQNGIYPTQPKDLLNWQTKERQRDCHYSNPFQYCAISTAAGFVLSQRSALLFRWNYIQFSKRGRVINT